MLSMRQDVAIGIDLGTTFSCVGVYRNGAVRIISNEDGNRITPSCVSFTENGILKGERAKQRLSMAAQNTVYEVKRLMGKSYDDPTVQSDMKTWPFKVVNDGGKPKIEVKQQGKTKKLAPEELSAMILTNMKQIAEKHLEMPVSKAVITVPAYFDANQRHATEVAAQIAGLDVLRIINEPTAAALAYYDEGDFPSGKNVMVFDIGGGTFDVSILRFEPGILEVIATKGDTHLGGADFDNRMVKKCLEWFHGNNRNTTVGNNPISGPIIRLRNECERIKCLLSKRDKADVHVELFCDDDKDFQYSFTRSVFESLNAEDFTKTIGIVEEALSDAKLRKDQIDDIVLVGGSSRIPKIQSLLQTFFNNKTINKSINPDEAVAQGAALQAALLNGDQGKQIKELLLLDVTPLSLGVEIKGQIMSTIIERNTLIPTSHTGNYTTIDDYQTSIRFGVYQGERSSTRHNHKIGSITIKDIPPQPAGVPKVKVTMDVNTNGTIFVVVKDKSTGNEKHITITNDKTRASKEDVKQMIEDAAYHQRDDDREYQRVLARNDMESFAKWMKFVTEEFADNLNLHDEPDEIKSALQWIDSHNNSLTEEYRMKKVELQEACDNIPSEYKNPGKLPSQHAQKYQQPRSFAQRQPRNIGSLFDLD